MTVNFKDNLDKDLTASERPPLPPVGEYVFQVMKIPEWDEGKGGGEYDILNFSCQAVSASDSVNSEAVAEFGDVSNIHIRHSFIFSCKDERRAAQTEYGLRMFLENMGLSGDYKKALNDCVNSRFLGTVAWKPRRDNPEIFDANITKTAPVS